MVCLLGDRAKSRQKVKRWNVGELNQAIGNGRQGIKAGGAGRGIGETWGKGWSNRRRKGQHSHASETEACGTRRGPATMGLPPGKAAATLEVPRRFWFIRVAPRFWSVAATVVVQVRLADMVMSLRRMVSENSELTTEPERTNLGSVLKLHALGTERFVSNR